MRITHDGKLYRSWTALAAAHGVAYQTYSARFYRQGWDQIRAATEPAQPDRFLTHETQTFTIAEWARRLGLTQTIISHRLGRGFSISDALNPIRERKNFETPEERRAARADREEKRRRGVRSAIQKYKRRPCKDCGGTFHLEAMEFDHCRGKKLFNLSRPPTPNLRRIAEEIAKCDVICANCHRVRTAKRRGLTLHP